VALIPLRVIAADLSGDGTVDDQDLSALLALFGSARGDARYQTEADLDGDGDVDVGDAALVTAAFGARGDPDVLPPRLEVTLEDIPPDMNALLVVPPERFRITIQFDAGGGSLVDPGSLAIYANRSLGDRPPGTDLVDLFAVTATRAVWMVPAGAELQRTSYTLHAALQDMAGNRAARDFGFAVRDFAFGAPLGRPQLVYLDFGVDRSLGPEADFTEDLRNFGLSSPLAPAIEARMRQRITARILEKINLQFGRHADGSAADDSADVRFVQVEPSRPHSRLCIGGESPLDASLLGAVVFDENNLVENADECAEPELGVFPQAIDILWWADADFAAAFAAVHPELGGTPVGEGHADAAILRPDFSRDIASPSVGRRFDQIERAVEAFSGAVATATSHEVGHMLGITAEGAVPAGLFGDSQHHNRRADGSVPAAPYIMNPGDSFSFAEVAGLSTAGLARFRALNWAYLRDRIAPSALVTALHDPPVLHSVEPRVFFAGTGALSLILRGSSLVAGPAEPSVELVDPRTQSAVPVPHVQRIDDEALALRVDRAFLSPGVYDLRYIGSDGQITTLRAGLELRPAAPGAQRSQK
jgi:hypothetical protein